MAEGPGEPIRDKGFKARKREDHALVLIEGLKGNLGDVVKVRKIARELGRYYVPVLGASTGMAAISLLLFLFGESAGEGYKKIKRADRYAIMFELVVLAVFLTLLGSAAGPIVSGHFAALFWGGLVMAGLLIPLVLEVSGLRLPGVVPAALILAGGFILRYVIVMANA